MAHKECSYIYLYKMYHEILVALEKPEVGRALRAFLDYVQEVTGENICSNYYDKVLAGAIATLRRSGKYDQKVAYNAMQRNAAQRTSLNRSSNSSVSTM